VANFLLLDTVRFYSVPPPSRVKVAPPPFCSFGGCVVISAFSSWGVNFLPLPHVTSLHVSFSHDGTFKPVPRP